MACWPLETIGQVISKRPMIVYLGTGTSRSANRYIDALRGGLAELGLAEGRNIEIVVRSTENHVERLQGLAEESVALKPALIAAGSSDAAVAAKSRRAFGFGDQLCAGRWQRDSRYALCRRSTSQAN
jgi:hypothetical protein